jgi:hypothetical protein
MGVSDFSSASMAGLRSLTFPAPSGQMAPDVSASWLAEMMRAL